MARWHIQLLGDLAIRPAGDPDANELRNRFRWQKVGSLLARLAWHPGERVSREVLTALLWPGETIEKGRENLRAALASLRRQLEPPGVEPGTILVTHGRSHVSLNPDAVETDVSLFDQAFRQERYALALALYKGPLLPHLYEDWALVERERLEELADRARRRHDEPLSLGKSLSLPPLETFSIDAPDIRLPFRLTRFHGRNDEIAELTELLRRERLVTVTGAGGTGKTRFAIEVAEALAPEYRSVCFVPLADLTNSSAIAGHISNRMEMVTTPRIESVDALATALNQRAAPVLLALDNFEHLTGEADGPLFVHDLLERVPTLTCLVTSRHRLGILGEREFPLAPLPIPPPDASPERLQEYPSVRVFVDRAQAVRPDFQLTARNAAAIAAICRRLEGIPLAIELAAARVRTLTVDQITLRLENRFSLLTGGTRTAVPRHQTLHACLEWSYALLNESERLLLQRLSVFVGGWSLAGAESVCSGDGIEEGAVFDLLTSLVEKSLVLFDDGRYRMLETLREFAAEKLRSQGRESDLSIRHTQWCLELSRVTHWKLDSRNDADDVDTAARIFIAEIENVRAAIHRCQQSTDHQDWETGLRLVMNQYFLGSRLYFYEESRGYLYDFLFVKDSHVLSPEVYLDALRYYADMLACIGGNDEEVLARYTECLHLARKNENRPQIISCLERLSWFQADETQGRISIETALQQARELGDPLTELGLLSSVAAFAKEHGDFSAARTFYEDALAMARRLGKRRSVASLCCELGWFRQNEKNFGDAKALYDEALQIAYSIPSHGLTNSALSSLCRMYKTINDLDNALVCAQDILLLSRREKHKGWELQALQDLASIYMGRKDYAPSYQTNVEACALLRRSGTLTAWESYFLRCAGDALMGMGNHHEAERFFTESLQSARRHNSLIHEADVYWSMAQMERSRRDFRKAESLLREMIRVNRRAIGDGLRRDLMDTVDCLLDNFAALYIDMGRYGEAAILFGFLEAREERLYINPTAAEANEREEYLSHLRETLSFEEFLKASVFGREMTKEAALAMVMYEE